MMMMTDIIHNCFQGHYTSILKLLVSEFTLAESGANTTTSLLRSMCHADDSVILGTWLHHTHHKAIEDQVGTDIGFCLFLSSVVLNPSS